MKPVTSQYANEGVAIIRNAVEPKLTMAARKEIMGVVEEASGRQVCNGEDARTFVVRSTEAVWEAVTRDPAKRNLLYTYMQRIPSLFQFGNLKVLREFSEVIGMKKPSVREIKIQMFLPWEKLFLQDCHQDINSLDSENSVTFWIPLHDLDEKSAVTYWAGSHKEGPVPHEAVADEDQAIFLERVPEEFRRKYPVLRKAVAREGDIITINRLVFHQSPRFEDQLYSRWSVVVRYDDIAGNGLYLNTSKYAALTPNSPEKMKGKLDRMRAFLSEKPKINWPEKLKQMKG